MAGYKRRINFVKHGDAATAGNVGKPDRELHGNIEYLKSLIDAAFLGQALFAREQTLESSLKVGQPVYWDATTETFRPALSAATTQDGKVVAAVTAEVVGIVYAKQASTQGDILLAGFAEVDLTEAIDGSVAAGRYYLSGITAGKLVRSRPAAAVSVLYALGNGFVAVSPSTRDFLEDHVHYSFELVCEPAGTHVPPSPGGTHTITSADASLSGWLPADHSSFDNKAPSGAAFGYNLAADTSLLAVWPPVPATAAVLTLDKGSDYVGGTNVPLGADGLVVLDQYGIWWMSNCYGDVPWPTDFTAAVSSSSEHLECPRHEAMRLRLDFIRMAFATDRNVVTKLQSLSSSLEIVDCNGAEASVGDLFLRLTLALTVDGDLSDGDLVLKDFDPETQLFSKGPVVEQIKAGTGVTITSTREIVTGEHQGTVTISLSSSAGHEIAPELVRVDDMPDRYDGNVAYLSFLDGEETGVRLRFDIPSADLGDNPTVKLRAQLLGTAAGTPPDITFSAIRIPRPTGTPALPSGDTAVDFDVPAAGTLAADDYFEVESDAFEIAAGDIVFASLTRAGNDGYDGEIGLLRVGLVLQ
jgi:hypothetical protein